MKRRWQRAAGIDDHPDLFAADIQRKTKDENEPALVALMTQHAAPVIEWLADRHGLAFSLIDDFDYPGHSRRRMHGLPSRSGRELIDALRAAAEGAGVDILTEARVTTIHADKQRIYGVSLVRPDGSTDSIGCERLILACNGFGGNAGMVAAHMPAISGAQYFGHPGNQGEAMIWGQALDAEIRYPSAYQGHGNVAHPHGILITWAVITEGGCQVNREGRRFWNEAQGYSEAARAVLGQPGGDAVAAFDSRIAAVARQFADFCDAEAQGAVRCFDTMTELAQGFGLPVAPLKETMEAFESTKRGAARDPFGRVLTGAVPLRPPYCGVRVTGALFHTQGGLAVDGGALSGNGLLAAITLGKSAGRPLAEKRR